MKIYNFEGLPGSGKSTIIENLSRGDPDVCTVRERVDNPFPYDLDNEEIFKARQNYFLGENIEQAQEIKDNFAGDGKPNNILLDRYFPSTLCFSYANSKIKEVEVFEENKKVSEKLIERGDLLEPDKYIYMEVPVAESIKRHKVRGEPEKLKEQKNEESFLKYSEEFYEDFFNDKENVIRIDGTGDIEENVEILLEELDLDG